MINPCIWEITFVSWLSTSCGGLIPVNARYYPVPIMEIESIHTTSHSSWDQHAQGIDTQKRFPAWMKIFHSYLLLKLFICQSYITTHSRHCSTLSTFQGACKFAKECELHLQQNVMFLCMFCTKPFCLSLETLAVQNHQWHQNVQSRSCKVPGWDPTYGVPSFLTTTLTYDTQGLGKACQVSVRIKILIKILVKSKTPPE